MASTIVLQSPDHQHTALRGRMRRSLFFVCFVFGPRAMWPKIGFENKNKELRNNAAASNQVVLQEDRKNIDERVVSHTKPNTDARSRQGKVTLTEPEPEAGWEKYDSYLANNLNIPEDYKPQPTETSSVELSFEVDKNGEPINIKVEKSLCSSCDKEAIRLIRAGPKWKRNANKKGRTTVTINF